MFALLLAASLDLASAQALHWYEELLAESGYGWRDRERAAFLIRERDGTLTLQPWSHGDVRCARFRGTIPARTIAILHTHPAKSPEPSTRDRAEARRLGLAVVAITPRSVIAFEPTEEKTRVLASGTSRGPSARRSSLPR